MEACAHGGGVTSLLVVIPYLVHPWALEDCLESMGSSSEGVLVVDNSRTKDARPVVEAIAARGGVRANVVAPAGNIGIAASWNLGLAQGADQTIVCSQWVRFAAAELPRRRDGAWGLDYFAGGTRDHATPYGCTFAEQGFHLISVGSALVDAIGYFDHAFRAYGEDDDYRWRMELAGLGGAMGCWPTPNVFSIGYGIAKRTPGVLGPAPDRLDSGHYWRLKWGTEGSHERGGYQTPFGNPNHPLSFVPTVKL